MKRNLPTAWAGLVLAQMKFLRQSTDLLAGTTETGHLYEAWAKPANSRNPVDGRLNPIEFHGKRWAPALRGSQDKSTG